METLKEGMKREMHEDRNKYKIKIMKEQNNGGRVGLEGKLNVGKEKGNNVEKIGERKE